MNKYYGESATFRDEVFDLKGREVKAMWHMLCQNGKDLVIEYSDVFFEEDNGGAYWEATYTFSPTKRKVLNKITARLKFRDGKIVEHVDVVRAGAFADSEEWAVAWEEVRQAITGIKNTRLVRMASAAWVRVVRRAVKISTLTWPSSTSV